MPILTAYMFVELHRLQVWSILMHAFILVLLQNKVYIIFESSMDLE